jgi:hypothetical protein
MGIAPKPDGSAGQIAVDDPAFGGQVKADGRLLQKYAKKYRVSAIAFHSFPPKDPYDAGGLQKSLLYDIRNADILIPIPFDAAFRDRLKHGAIQTNYGLLLVPNGVEMSDFDTTRQAANAGVKVLATHSGPP